MKIYILQRSIRSEGNHFHLIGAHQNLLGAKEMVRGYSQPLLYTPWEWKYYGFCHYLETDQNKIVWKISEVELEGYIPPQAEPLEFSPVPEG